MSPTTENVMPSICLSGNKNSNSLCHWRECNLFSHIPAGLLKSLLRRMDTALSDSVVARIGASPSFLVPSFFSSQD